MEDKEAKDVIVETPDLVVEALEETKVGMKFEVVLSKPVNATPPRKPSIVNDKAITSEDIENKLKAAHERRQSIEIEKVGLVTKAAKIQEANEKKKESNLKFIQSIKEKLQSKLEVNKENRETVIKEKQEKVKASLQHVEEVRKSMATQMEELMNNIQRKITNATTAREAQISALQQRLKEHELHLTEVRKAQEDLKEELREKQMTKLKLAEENRNTIFELLQNKIVEHKKHIEEVRQNKLLNNSKNDVCQEDEVIDSNGNVPGDVINDEVNTDSVVIENTPTLDANKIDKEIQIIEKKTEELIIENMNTPKFENEEATINWELFTFNQPLPPLFAHYFSKIITNVPENVRHFIPSPKKLIHFYLY